MEQIETVSDKEPCSPCCAGAAGPPEYFQDPPAGAATPLRTPPRSLPACENFSHTLFEACKEEDRLADSSSSSEPHKKRLELELETQARDDARQHEQLQSNAVVHLPLPQQGEAPEIGGGGGPPWPYCLTQYFLPPGVSGSLRCDSFSPSFAAAGPCPFLPVPGASSSTSSPPNARRRHSNVVGLPPAPPVPVVLGRLQQQLQLPVLIPGGPPAPPPPEAKNEGSLSCSTQGNEQHEELPLAADAAHAHGGETQGGENQSSCSSRPGPPYGYYHWQHATPLRVRSNWMRIHASRMHASGAETCTSRRKKLLSTKYNEYLQQLATHRAAADDKYEILPYNDPDHLHHMRCVMVDDTTLLGPNVNVPSWERRFWQRDATAAEREQMQYLLLQEKKLSMDEAGFYTEEDYEDLVNIAGRGCESQSLSLHLQTSVRDSGGLLDDVAGRGNSLACHASASSSKPGAGRGGNSCADHEKIPEESGAGGDKASPHPAFGSQDAAARVSVASSARAHQQPAACTHELSIGIGVPSAYRAHATKGAKTPMNSLKTFDFETGDFVTLSSCSTDRDRTRHKIKVAARQHQNNIQEKDDTVTPRGAAAGAAAGASSPSSSSSSSAVPVVAPATSTCSYSRSAIRTLPEQLQHEKWEQEKLKNREDSSEYDEDSDLLRTCTRDVNLHQVWLRKKRLLIRETHEGAAELALV